MRGPGRGQPHRDLVDRGFEQLAGGALGVAPAVARRGSRSRSARVNAALSICSAAARRRALSKRGARCCAPRRARRVEGCAVQVQAARIGAPLRHAAAPRRVLRVWRGGWPSARPPAAPRVNGPSTSVRLWAAHSRSWVERRDHAVMVSRSTPASSAIPVAGSTGSHSKPEGVVQFAAQGGLIDHPGRPGFVIQRGPVDGHHRAVGAGLAVGDDDVGVQVRVPAPRGLVLIGDRHQPGQPHQVLLAGVRVVDPGVAGMGGQVFHRLGDRGGVGVGDRLGQHIVIAAQRPHQRHTLGRAERQIEPVHPALPERAPAAHRWVRRRRRASAPPPRHRPHRPTRWASVRPTNAGDGVGVAGQQPCRGAGFVLGVVLPQPATRACHDRGWRVSAVRAVSM